MQLRLLNANLVPVLTMGIGMMMRRDRSPPTGCATLPGEGVQFYSGVAKHVLSDGIQYQQKSDGRFS
jgi:hypothetical protein